MSSFSVRQYICTITYIVVIMWVNFVFTHVPYIQFLGHPISAADFMIGIVYVMRDFSQREIRQLVLPAMLLGCFLSYMLADKYVAVASVISFCIGEVIDYLIFTFTKKPLSQRLLWSSLISDPIDSFVFLLVIGKLNWVGVMVLSIGKVTGALAVWAYWRYRQAKNLAIFA